MVTTVRPNASETPTRPIPTSGNFAASTALPQPPNTSQNVPNNSAAERLRMGMSISLDCSSQAGTLCKLYIRVNRPKGPLDGQIWPSRAFPGAYLGPDERRRGASPFARKRGMSPLHPAAGYLALELHPGRGRPRKAQQCVAALGHERGLHLASDSLVSPLGFLNRCEHGIGTRIDLVGGAGRALHARASLLVGHHEHDLDLAGVLLVDVGHVDGQR